MAILQISYYGEKKIITVIYSKTMNLMKRMNEMLKQGILPPELDFGNQENGEIDWNMVRYNTFYKTPEFVLERFPNSEAFLNLPGGLDILSEMAEKMTTPLDEIEERRKVSDKVIVAEEKESHELVDKSVPSNNEESESTRLVESVVSEPTETK